MENEIEIKEAIKANNEMMLLNKRIVDFDKAMDSFKVFYFGYLDEYEDNILKAICSYKKIASDNTTALEIQQVITAFVNSHKDELSRLIDEYGSKIKDKMPLLDDNEYRKELNQMMLVIVNSISEFCTENINMLIEECVKGEDEDTNNKITNYLKVIVYGKLINTLRDNFSYSIRIIDNNHEENNRRMEIINQKTLNRV